MPKPESEESIAERAKLRRQRSHEIAKITGSEKKAQVNRIKYRLLIWWAYLKVIPQVIKKIRNRNNMLDIVELILEFNKQNQSRQGLKILTPNQIPVDYQFL